MPAVGLRGGLRDGHRNFEHEQVELTGVRPTHPLLPSAQPSRPVAAPLLVDVRALTTSAAKTEFTLAYGGPSRAHAGPQARELALCGGE